MELTAESLLDLPRGAEYRKESGRASAAVRNEGGRIVVYATCDSLQALVDYYERLERVWKAESSSAGTTVTETAARQAPSVRTILETFIAGLVAGIAITVITVIMKKTWF